MIVIIIVRRGLCEICGKWWDLEFGEDPPETCNLCGSRNWEQPQEVRDATYIRKGITKAKRRLNPGSRMRVTAPSIGAANSAMTAPAHPPAASFARSDQSRQPAAPTSEQTLRFSTFDTTKIEPK